MPKPKKGPRLGSGPAHQRLMLRNLARSLFRHERIQTTEAKAKMLRPFAERLITRAKSGTVHDRRHVLSEIEDREVVHKLFADIAPRFGTRNGGYTRILKVGPRNGDGAPMALVELVDEAVRVSEETQESRRRRLRRPARRRTGEAAPAAGAAPEGGPAEEEREAPPAADAAADGDEERAQS